MNAERARVSSAVLNWVGSYGKWGGVEASEHAQEFTPSGDRETLREVLELLRRSPPRRPRLVMAYLAGADHAGHEAGPDSSQTERKIRALDDLLSSLLTGIENLPDAANINLIVVSDHGMALRRGWLDVQGVLSRRHLPGRTFASGGTANVYLTKPSDRAKAMKALSVLPGLEVFQSGALPPELRYGFPGRTGDLVLVASVGIELGREPNPRAAPGGGVHGYRGTEDEMGGIFYGWGSAFRPGIRAGRIDAVSVYSIACAILGIRPSERAQGVVPDGMLTPRWEKLSRNPRR